MNKYFNKLKPLVSISNLNDFEKVLKNIKEYKSECENLNVLISSNDPYKELESLIESNPKIKEVLLLLLAVRQKDIYNKTGYESIEQTSTSDWIKMIKESEFVEFLRSADIKDVYTYLCGVEVGMDTNARKNRSGMILENIVQELLINDEELENVRSQVAFSEITEKYGIDYFGTSKKIDFVFDYDNTTYLVEVNCYNTNGSKVNAISEDYRAFEQMLRKVKGLEFIWITAGPGWKQSSAEFDKNSTELSYFLTVEQLQDYDNKISNILQKN